MYACMENCCCFFLINIQLLISIDLPFEQLRGSSSFKLKYKPDIIRSTDLKQTVMKLFLSVFLTNSNTIKIGHE